MTWPKNETNLIESFEDNEDTLSLINEQTLNSQLQNINPDHKKCTFGENQKPNLCKSCYKDFYDKVSIEDENTNSKMFKYFTYALWILGFGLIIGFFIWLANSSIGQSIYISCLLWIQNYVNEGSYTSLILLYAIQVFFSCIAIPGQTFTVICMGFIMKEFFKPWIIATLGGYLGAICWFILIRYLFKPYINKYFSSSIVFNVLVEETKENPWSVSTFANFIMIPVAIKNTLLPMTEMTLWQFSVPKLPIHMGFCAVYVFIGMQVKTIGELMGSKSMSHWKSKDIVNFIVTIVLLATSAAIIVLFAVVVSSKVKFVEEVNEKIKKEKKFKNRLKKMGLDDNEIDYILKMVIDVEC